MLGKIQLVYNIILSDYTFYLKYIFVLVKIVTVFPIIKNMKIKPFEKNGVIKYSLYN